MTRQKAGEINRKMPVYSTWYGRHTRIPIRSQSTMRLRNLGGGIRYMQLATICERNGKTHSRTPSWLGGSNKSPIWYPFQGFRMSVRPDYLPQWIAPHDVQRGFYRFLKSGQAPNDGTFAMGRITAVAPLCKQAFLRVELNNVG